MVDFGGDERGSDESVASDNDVVLGFDDDEREVSMIRESEVEVEKLENDIIKDEEGPKKEQRTTGIDEDDFDPEAILAPCEFPQWFLDWFDQKKLAKWVIKGDAKRTESMRI
ncbi:hypothetical protein BDQ17DRAFT_1353055 [Cyathus striatus]|nr:hypothetical protein BDQ17DRAFT_1383124 [Cyathus striatus]KAF9005431.1 hypothetical protein BDQ17DRAFT_1353055 [Cyathus striatus]